MKEAFPNYYRKFRCIADKCVHSCCIGWEIDVDEKTFGKYSALKTGLGEKLRANIAGNPPHFVLQEGERCPFLNERGLCDIILTHGEDMLCDICTLHPRFRNFYSDFVEIGLGLCCEEAARVILGEEEKLSIQLPEGVTLTADEREFFAIRAEILRILQDREKSINERFCALAEKFGFGFSFSLPGVVSVFLSLERLDENWTREMKALSDFSFDGGVFERKELSVAFEQLAASLIFRHLPEAIYDGEYAARVQFCLLGCFLVGALWDLYITQTGGIFLADMAEVVRMFSSEVEYSEENTQALLDVCACAG